MVTWGGSFVTVASVSIDPSGSWAAHGDRTNVVPSTRVSEKTNRNSLPQSAHSLSGSAPAGGTMFGYGLVIVVIASHLSVGLLAPLCDEFTCSSRGPNLV